MENLTLQSIEKEELIVFQQLFSIYDKEDTGKMSTADFPQYMRGLGHCPTEKQLQQICQTLDPHKQGDILFNELVNVILKRKKEQNIQEELMEAFEGLNSEAGSHSQGQKTFKMSATGAKKYLTEFGQKFNQAEVQQFLQFLEQNNLKTGHEFNYCDLAKILSYSYMN